ncbi:hypothetical protein N7517_009615 [Penicillium concentricum]|uniref:Uncharacterized protein n=1 Tax=Penicillium concentricum TaxID=293559 RepID=A0A9W9RKB0_9EURO|nr:uncharacterized protein N7517_009615 [Penicillium concentricum]KAJ5360424.1 hypothetical protein N7517_009615 [Penicillium concentricum]
MSSIIAAYEELPEYLQILGAIVVIMASIPIISRIGAVLIVGCLIVASTLGLIDWDWSDEQAIAKVDRIPDSSEKSAILAEAGQCTPEAGQFTETGEKGRLEIEIESLEETLHARREELAQLC